MSKKTYTPTIPVEKLLTPAKVLEPILNELEPVIEAPVVRRYRDGWALYLYKIQGNTVLERRLVHGPNLRRVCNARAIHIMESA